MSRVAHRISDGQKRSRDVVNDENVNVDFASLLLSSAVQAGLESAGFERPSPIQLKAIPLGRCGLDLIVQAKSGTGKTCVFSVIALESLDTHSSSTQVLVLAPTREIAVQIQDVILSLGSAMSELRCHVFIGGTMIGPDKQKLKKCHIAVGTPGRIKQLIEFELLKTESIRLFVLDEADKLLDHKFKEQVNWIYHQLVENKQMLALSATYPEYLAQQLTTYMRDPTFVRLNRKDLALHGIKQYYKIVAGHRLSNKAFENKVEHLLQILSQVAFNQCLIFSNLQTRAQNLSDMLNFKGWPSTYISGHQEQAHRLSAMAMLKKFQCRILISTDLTARGIDAENVNLIINLDVPFDIKTYFHRIGRAGRFGTQGAAITLASTGQEEIHLTNIKKHCHGKMVALPDTLPSDLVTQNKTPEDLGYSNLSSDDSDLDSLPLEDHEIQEKQTQKRQQPDKNTRKWNQSYKDQNEQIEIVGSRVVHPTNDRPINPKNHTKVSVVDKGCQTKPSNILTDIFGIDALDFKIPSLSTHRVHRQVGECWTYEKAKKDLQEFLDPSLKVSESAVEDDVHARASPNEMSETVESKSLPQIKTEQSAESLIESMTLPQRTSEKSEDNLHELVEIKTEITGQSELVDTPDALFSKNVEPTVQMVNSESKFEISDTSNCDPQLSGENNPLQSSNTQSDIPKLTSSKSDTAADKDKQNKYRNSSKDAISKNGCGKRDNSNSKVQQSPPDAVPQTNKKHQKRGNTSDFRKDEQNFKTEKPPRCKPLSVASTLQQIQCKTVGDQDCRKDDKKLKEEKPLRLKTLSVAGTLQQIQSNTTDQDAKFHSSSDDVDPVWESYRKLLPSQNSKQSHDTNGGCSSVNACDASSDASQSSSTSSSQASDSESTDSSETDSDDESTSSESDSDVESELDEEEDYEAELNDGVKGMEFGQYATGGEWDATWQGSQYATGSEWDASWQGSAYPYWYQTNYSPYVPNQLYPYQYGYHEQSMYDYNSWYQTYQY